MQPEQLIITTMNRPELTQRAVTSFNTLGLPTTVYDQSEERTSYVGAQTFGPPEVEQLIEQLVAGGIDEELIRWGLVGGHGGYRNVAQLNTVGKLVLSTDDDTVCTLVGSPEQEQGFTYGEPSPGWRLYKSRAGWQSEADTLPRTHAVAAEHAKYLGERTQDGYTFCIVAAGLIGDSAASYNNNLLATGDRHKRLVSDYQSLRDTREVMQIVNKATMMPGGRFLRTMNYSFDNRNFLPPFPPNGRGECAVFATLLGCLERTVIAYLPWGIVHVPPEGRKYSQRYGPLIFDEAFYAVLAGMPLQADYHELSRALIGLDALSGHAMIDFFSSYREREQESLRRLVLDQILPQGGPTEWKADCEALLEESHKPLDITVEQAAGMREELVRYGELMGVWPIARLLVLRDRPE